MMQTQPATEAQRALQRLERERRRVQRRMDAIYQQQRDGQPTAGQAEGEALVAYCRTLDTRLQIARERVWNEHRAGRA